MRFAGDRSFYNNNEVRMKLFNIKTYLFPAEMGIHGFFDTGRVWVKNDPSTPTGTSNEWHQGYGGGLWLSPFAKAVFSLDLSRSVEEELLPFVRFGFMF
jgi:hemolysin activation/secretion protein